MRAGIPLVLGSILFASAAAVAEPLTLREVLESVRDRFPPQSAAALETALANADLLSAQGGFDVAAKAKATHDPEFDPYSYTTADVGLEQPTPLWGTTLRGGWRLGVGDIPSYYGEKRTNELGEARVGVTVPLWRNGPTDRRRANVWRAEHQQALAAATVRQSLLENARNAAFRYFEWVAAGRRVTIAEELLLIATTRDSQLGERAARGDLPAIEQADNRRVIEQRRAQLASARQAFVSASLELGLYLRTADGTPVTPGAELLPPLPGTASVAAAPTLDDIHARRPELARLTAQRKQTQVELDLATNQQAPGVDVLIDYSQDLGAGDSKLGKPNLQAGLSLDLPLQVRVARGREEAARASLERIDHLERFAKDRILVELRDAENALGLAGERVDAARRELELARTLEAAERTRLDLGTSTLLLVNIREQTTFETRHREVDALLSWHRAHVALTVARGKVPELDD